MMRDDPDERFCIWRWDHNVLFQPARAQKCSVNLLGAVCCANYNHPLGFGSSIQQFEEPVHKA